MPRRPALVALDTALDELITALGDVDTRLGLMANRLANMEEKATMVLQARPLEAYKLAGVLELPELLVRARGELEQLKIRAQQVAGDIGKE